MKVAVIFNKRNIPVACGLNADEAWRKIHGSLLLWSAATMRKRYKPLGYYCVIFKNDST